jgi:hypothetical protein
MPPGTYSVPREGLDGSKVGIELHVRSWCADMAAKTPGSARSAYRLLKAIFNTANLDDLIVKNPCRVKGGGHRSMARNVCESDLARRSHSPVQSRLRDEVPQDKLLRPAGQRIARLQPPA